MSGKAMIQSSYFLATPLDTRELGRRLGEQLAEGGGLMLVGGPLGAGKTTLVQGLAVGLGVDEPDEVRSATFSLMDIHPGRTPLVHVDLYRIAESDELEVLDLPTWLDGGSVVAVEWPERAPELTSMARIIIDLSEEAQGRRALVQEAVGAEHR